LTYKLLKKKIMVQDISYTAIGTFNDTHITVHIALDDPSNNHPFKIVEKYDLSRSFGTKFYNAVLLHVDNGTAHEVRSTSHSFPAVIEIASLFDIGNAERFDVNLSKTLFFVAHEKEILDIDFDDLVCKIPDYDAKVEEDGSFSESYDLKEGIVGPPKKIGISLIRK
jgi:hypothetical protein